VYDIPRPQLEAVYINKGFDDDRPTYDTPRTKKGEMSVGYPEEGEDHGECNYDVPKVSHFIFFPGNCLDDGCNFLPAESKTSPLLVMS
jgi:hypothetical protein